MKLKNKTTVIEASSSNQPLYAEIQAVAPPNAPSKSEDLVNLNSPLTIGYSEIELEPDDRKQALPAKPPRACYILRSNSQSNGAPTLCTRT